MKDVIKVIEKAIDRQEKFAKDLSKDIQKYGSDPTVIGIENERLVQLCQWYVDIKKENPDV